MGVDGARIQSIQVGLPQLHGDENATDPMDKPWESAIFKYPVEGKVKLGTVNLEGDGQADLRVHGGPDMAVTLYSAEHYPYWHETLPEIPWVNGGFGENFTVEGQTEATVCIGDVYTVGNDGVKVEVSQPREPCWKLARRWKLKDLTARVAENGRSGWYVRVLQTGEVQAGDTLTLVARPNPKITITYLKQGYRRARQDKAIASELAAVEGLSESWRVWFADRAR